MSVTQIASLQTDTKDIDKKEPLADWQGVLFLV